MNATLVLPSAEVGNRLEAMRRAIGGGDDAAAYVPEVDGEFEAAPDLEAIAEELIADDRDAFGHLVGCRIVWFWRKKAGKSGGRTVFGKCQLASGLLAHVTDADVVIWLGADACREAELTNRQLEATVFHELCKIEWVEDKAGNGKWGLRPPDFAGFVAELERYGAWRAGLREAGQTFRRVPLFALGEAA